VNQLVDLQAAARMIGESNRILFFLHVSPDGDSIGSTLGMVRSLRQMGKTAIIVGVDPVPPVFRFLAGWDTLFVPWHEVEGEWDLACFLDCGDLQRVGAAEPVVSRAKRSLNIDHHLTNAAYGDFNYLDFTAAAAGELAYRILLELKAPIDTEVAVCIYTSLVTDTGSFRYDSTAASTHRIAAELIELGARPYEVASEIFENESLARLALLARVFSTIEIDKSGKVAWIMLSREMLRQTGASDQDAEGLVNHARSISGVEVGLMFREAPDGLIRVGLRSRRTVDVAAVAVKFGGGGHARAAGCTLSGTLEEARQAVVSAVLEVL
jgi:phosphoesterase RecJ-like protein